MLLFHEKWTKIIILQHSYEVNVPYDHTLSNLFYSLFLILVHFSLNGIKFNAAAEYELIFLQNKKALRSISRWTGICSSDGKFGLFAPARGGLEVLDLKKGQTLRTLIPRVIEGINEIRAEFTPCNTYILYYHNGHKTLRIFRTSDGQMISCFKPHAQLTTFIASKDGKKIIIGGVDGSVLVTALVDPQDPKSLHYLAKQPGRKVLADHLGVENIETEETLRSFSNLRVVGKAINKFKSLINHDQKPSAVCVIQ